VGQSQFLNGGFGDDHHSRFASTLGVPTGHGAKTKALIIFFGIASFRKEFHWPCRHSAVF